jgi:Tetratrico peptide repeat
VPPDNAIEMFERASALDSTGHPNLAAPLYRQALIGGLAANVPPCGDPVGELAAEPRSPRGKRALLTAELEAGSDHLDDAVRAFLAFALVDLRQEREATLP